MNENKNIIYLSCDTCHYITDKQKDYNKHLLTLKHQKLVDGKVFIRNPIYRTCDKCHYITNNQKDFTKHLLTRKHQTSLLSSQMNNLECLLCNKTYMNYSGLWKHKKKCGVLIP